MIFYIENLNLCVEYDGEQHFKKLRFEENDEKLKIRKLRDNIKNNYCMKNNIILLRIKFDENVIERLTNTIKSLNFK